MAVVKAFTGWRYNPNRFPDLSQVVVPPYDVISESELTHMRHQSEFNFSQIILPEGDEKHKKAASLFKQWQHDEVFVHDTKPTLYFYQQTFSLTKAELFCQNVTEHTLRRTGILCRVGLEEYADKVILPHEKTFSGPKADRYKLMEASQGNMEPVFLGYDSPRFGADEFQKIVLGQKPEYTFSDGAGVKHELWRITDEKVHHEVESVLKAKRFYILDGHHRYETALQFFKDHQKSDARVDHRYVLANICSFRQPGTVILPTHRAVGGLTSFSFEEISQKLQAAHFKVTQVDKLDTVETTLKESKTAAFGLKLRGLRGYATVIAPEFEGKLDLEVLHQDILPLLGAPDTLTIDYIKDIGQLGDAVDKGSAEAGFLVRPSTVDEVMQVADRSHVMPHKSTFFYPKIPSGLVVNTFE